MSSNSSFIKTLNSGDETPYNVKYYTITGTGCNSISYGDGDGIVKSTSVPLDGAINYKVSGKCSGTLNMGMHSDLLNPDKYPEVLEDIKKILNG